MEVKIRVCENMLFSEILSRKFFLIGLKWLDMILWAILDLLPECILSGAYIGYENGG